MANAKSNIVSLSTSLPREPLFGSKLFCAIKPHILLLVINYMPKWRCKSMKNIVITNQRTLEI